MKIEDFVHLYIGCRYWRSWDEKEGIINHQNIPTLLGSKVGYIKLILRPFSDAGTLSEEEQNKWNNTQTPIGEMTIESAHKIHWNKRMNFYRSIGIDCDGLIEGGLAFNVYDIS